MLHVKAWVSHLRKWIFSIKNPHCWRSIGSRKKAETFSHGEHLSNEYTNGKNQRAQIICKSGEHFVKLFVGDFHQQMLKATEILAADWLRANLLMKITDKMLHEMPPWMESSNMDKVPLLKDQKCWGMDRNQTGTLLIQSQGFKQIYYNTSTPWI